MKKITIKEAQSYMLEMLIELDRIAKKYNITYWLMGGTLIGALRHNGFIPWDDDLDIAMPPEDYKKFVSIVSLELNEKFFLQTKKTDKFWKKGLTKIRYNNTHIIETIETGNEKYHTGIFLDIFELQKVNSNSRIFNNFIKKIHVIRNVYPQKINFKEKSKSKLSNIVKNLIRLLPINPANDLVYKFICKIFLLLSRKKDSYTSSISTGYFGSSYFKLPAHTIDIEFCEKKFPIPQLYDDYLVPIFGDYMTLPSIEKRVSHSKGIYVKEI